MPINVLFEVIEEKEFTNAITSYRVIYDRIDDVRDAVDWLLARNPFIGLDIAGEEKHRIYLTTPVGATPAFWVLYRIEEDEQKIYLVSLDPIVRTDDE